MQMVHANAAGDKLAVAAQFLSGGVDSPVRAGKPVGEASPFIVSGCGSRVTDDEGREYIDYLCAYGPVMLGHGDPRIGRAIEAAARRGAVVGTTHPDEVRLAQRVMARFASIERIRFVTTGTEACMSAVRVARSFTRRVKLLRFSGCYHGHSDEMIFSAGASSLSAPALDAGVTPAVIGQVAVAPYNDVPALERVMREHGACLAAAIVEPICGNMGLCLPDGAFLAALRRLCSTHGVVLIFDEVITGFRVGPHGAQGELGVNADLTCLGKTLGGGLPIAAFGGRREIMDVLAPSGPVFVGGTFSGNPVCVAAAHAFLDALDDDPPIFDRLEGRSRGLARGLEGILAERGLPFPVVQCASMVDFMFRPGLAHRDMREAQTADAAAYARYYREMLERGVLLPPSQMELMFLTAAHTQADIDATLAAARESLAAMDV